MENLKSINIKGCKVCYTEGGNPDGDPVLLLHGWGCNHTTLASVEKPLLEKMHVYNLDLPGHGNSDEPADVWGVEDYTEMTEIFCRELGIQRPVLFGHSFGGRISILFASRNDVNKVVLCDAAGIKPKRSLKYKVKVGFFKIIKRVLPALFGKKLGGKMLDWYRRKQGSADYAAASPKMRAILSKCVNEDLKHVMPDIKAPTLLIWGNDDTATPLSDAKTMEKLIPGSGLVAFEGCGHYSFLDNPGQFRAVMQSFFNLAKPN